MTTLGLYAEPWRCRWPSVSPRLGSRLSFEIGKISFFSFAPPFAQSERPWLAWQHALAPGGCQGQRRHLVFGCVSVSV